MARKRKLKKTAGVCGICFDQTDVVRAEELAGGGGVYADAFSICKKCADAVSLLFKEEPPYSTYHPRGSLRVRGAGAHRPPAGREGEDVVKKAAEMRALANTLRNNYDVARDEGTPLSALDFHNSVLRLVALVLAHGGRSYQ